MSKVERLNARVAKLLTVAVQEVLEVIKETVSEYQEKTARTQRENERLRRRLQELQDKQRKSSIDLSCSIPGAGPPVSGGTVEKTPTQSSLDNLTLKQELNTETLQCSEHTPADVEQIIIKCDSPREQNEVSCQGMSVSQNDDITEDTDEDSVHFVACYKNSVAREIPKTRKSHRLTRNCKIETKAEEPSEAKTTPEKELFGDDQLSIRESLTIPNCGLIETQHSQLRHDDMLKTDSLVRVKVDTSPGNTSHTSLSGTAGYSYLTVQTQIKTEVDTDDCSSSIGAPQRDDYVTDFNGLRDEPELTQDQQAVTTATTVAASASSSCKMSYIPFSSNATGLQHDGLILENGYETQPQEPASGSVGVQFSMGPMSRRGLSGVSGGGGAVMGGRLPRPYTRHHHHPNHTGAPKRYCCAVCGRSFNHAGDFKKHKRVHTGEKPYACGVCGKRFSQSGYLTVHLRYHTGERPYSCGLCGRSFSHSSNFRKHQQTHIGQMLSNT